MKFCGKFGFVDEVDNGDGTWKPQIVEKTYFGDVISNARQLQNGESTNDTVNIRNTISVVADETAYRSIHLLRYVEWMGVKYKVSNVDVARPRLTLTIGGLWNESEDT